MMSKVKSETETTPEQRLAQLNNRLAWLFNEMTSLDQQYIEEGSNRAALESRSRILAELNTIPAAFREAERQRVLAEWQGFSEEGARIEAELSEARQAEAEATAAENASVKGFEM